MPAPLAPSLVALLLATASTAAAQPPQTDKLHRLKFARQAVGLSLSFMEAQRCGTLPADATTLAPQVWKWKKPAFANVCGTYQKQLSEAQRADAGMAANAGYFEAGNAVVATGPTAYAITQLAIGALQFGADVTGTPEATIAGDPAQCLPAEFRVRTVMSHVHRQLRHAGRSLAATIVKTNAANPLDYAQVIGVGDGSVFSNSLTTWHQPAATQDLCYVATGAAPAADVAAQTAAALALVSKHFSSSTWQPDVATLAPRLLRKAKAAYAYAKAAYTRDGAAASCTSSPAAKNCIGAACDRKSRGPCELYGNTKDARQQLFAAAAAIYYATGDAAYRADADTRWLDTSEALFYSNWNNVYPQGVMLLAIAPDAPGAAVPRTTYQQMLGKHVGQWSQCSNQGSLPGFCERTAGGNAYPVTLPWGNTGMGLQAVCAAAVYNKLATTDTAATKGARCFVHRQLGFLTNHKCAGTGYKCDTPDSEGFSYMVGLGKHYPRHIHSRDAATPYFKTPAKPDPNTLCGGIVSGPWIAPPSSTDNFTDSRNKYEETEAGLDYSGSVLCAFGGYAAVANGGFAGCAGARGPLDGRV